MKWLSTILFFFIGVFYFPISSCGQDATCVSICIQSTDSIKNLITSQPQIRIHAYNGNGDNITPSVIHKNGHWKLDVYRGHRVRLEFTNLPEGYYPLPGESTVQFVTAPAKVSLKIYNPSQYTGKSPIAVQAVYGRGAMTHKKIGNIASLVTYPAMKSDSMQYNALGKFVQTGSIWGLAYDRQEKRLFSAALAKRHSAFGSLGSGGIYVTDVEGKQTQPFVSLDALGFATSQGPFQRDLTEDWKKPDHDSLMFAQVGRIGLGGLDISDDSRYLYTVNLYDRKLYRIRLNENSKAPVTGDVAVYDIPVRDNKTGQSRPFAVKYYQGKVYVGVVMNAEKSGKAEDMMAYIYSMEADNDQPGKGKFKEVASFGLNYPRGILDYGVKGWYPWTDSYLKAIVAEQRGWMIYPQPIVADIEFDSDGSMIVSLMDRLGHQTGDGQLYRPHSQTSLVAVRGLSGGDVIRLARPKRNYQTEQNGRAGNRLSVVGESNGEGPGGGEFYADDAFSYAGVTWHRETAAGGLAILPEQERLLVSVREPGTYVTGGVKWFDNKTGAATGGFPIFPGGMKKGYFWKTNNVGDIELITDLPTTEIGDRIWLDNDGDGTQGADEPALPGVAVQLYKGEQQVGATVTDSLGRYWFNEKNVAEPIKSRTEYQIRVPMAQPVGRLLLTGTRQGASAELDNDAVAMNEEAVVTVKTTNPGENIHHVDFGFQCNDKPAGSVNVLCQNNQLQVTLTGTKASERYDMTPTGSYEGVALYKSARKIPASGLIAQAALNIDAPYEATVRVYAPSGCYNDVFINSANQPGCGYVSETLSLKESYSMAVYPNPSLGHSRVTYRGGASEGKVQIRLTDLKGRTINSENGNLVDGYYHGDINLAKQPLGTYLLTVEEEGKETTKSVIRQ